MTKKSNGKGGKSKKPVRRQPTKPLLKAHVTHLEMNTPLNRIVHAPSRPVTALMIAKNISASFYAFLYEQVGREHHWYDRRNMDPAELHATINDDRCQIGILYADGCPAGLYELDLQESPDFIEIRYFGLMKEYQGLGLGKWFLTLAIKGAWSHQPDKVIVETNTLDHPAALQLYQRMGFSPVAVSDVEIEPWD